MFNTVILYHYTINNDYTRYSICSAWFLDIRIYQLVFVILFTSTSDLYNQVRPLRINYLACSHRVKLIYLFIIKLVL